MAMQIRADGVDILIDLSGHTAHNRLLVFARKPAPIQVTYLGYLSTTGLESMDYRLTDHLGRAGRQRALLHRNVIAPARQHVVLSAARWTCPRSRRCLRSKRLPTFGSFNNIDKIGADAITLWAAVLQHLPTSRLLFLAEPEVHSHFLRQFDAHGIAAERITFFGKLAPEEFRRLVQHADISLGTPTPSMARRPTCESLWQGVPVLSLSGERVLSRNGLSILSAAQLPDFCAATPIELIKTARLLADNPVVLANIRAGMRDHLCTTPLLHQRHFVENLEALLRDAWFKWCRTVK